MKIGCIAVMGSGPGACAVAAETALAGHEVTLFDLPEFAQGVQAIKKAGGVQKVGGRREGFAKLKQATTDIRQAIEDAELIMPVVPTYAHKVFAQVLAPHLSEDQMIILNPGSTGGGLEFVRSLRESGYRREIRIAETSTLPYGARLIEPGKVRVFLEVKELYFAAFPAKKNEEFFWIFKEIYPNIRAMSNVLETGLNNGNPVSHPAAAILNAGRIEYTAGDYYHYREGITPSVARVMEGIDRERLNLCKEMGFSEIPTLERLYSLGYTDRKGNLYEAYRNSKVFAPMKAPADLQGRFISEDIPYGLVTWSSLGDMIGVATPLMKAIIMIASSLNQKNYLVEGRTVEKLGLAGMGVKQLNEFLGEGAL
jgi:opine dehydrogenase